MMPLSHALLVVVAQLTGAYVRRGGWWMPTILNETPVRFQGEPVQDRFSARVFPKMLFPARLPPAAQRQEQKPLQK